MLSIFNRSHFALLTTVFWGVTFSLPTAFSGEAAAVIEVFSKPIARLIFVVSGSEKTAHFMRELTHSSSIRTTDAAYNEFRQVLNWEDSHELRKVFAQKINQIEDEFGIYRKTIEKEAAVGAKELLTEAEILRLREITARTLDQDESLAQLVTRTRTAIERKIPKAQYDNIRLVDGTPDFHGKIPALPNMSKNLALDVKALDRKNKLFFKEIPRRVNDYYHFGKALVFTEGEWKSLFLAAGKQFTVNDWLMIRRWNLILSALTPKKQLELRLFARSQVRRQQEIRFNELTHEATVQHQRGEIGDQEWIRRRLTVATDKEFGIGLTPFDIAGEKQMLDSITKCRTLGGTSEGNFSHTGLINDLEKIIASHHEKKAKFQQALDGSKTKLAGLKFDLDATKKTKGIEKYKVDEIKISIQNEQREYDRLSSLQRENELGLVTSLSKLSHAYSDFYEAYYKLPVFVDARNGKIAGQSMTPIPFPDVLIPAQAELDAWATISDRALQNSIPTFIKGELKLFRQTQQGATKTFIRELDDSFEKIHGEPFTKSALGAEYQQFARNFFRDVGFQILKYVLPPAAAGAAADKYADHAFSKWMKSFFSNDTGKPETPDGVEKTPEPENNEKPTKSVKNPEAGQPVKNSDTPSEAGSRPPIVVTPPVTNPKTPKSPFGDPDKE